MTQKYRPDPTIRSHNFQMQILDTQFEFLLVDLPSSIFANGPLVEAAVENSDYAFLVFDMTRPETFGAVQKVYTRLNRLREALKQRKHKQSESDESSVSGSSGTRAIWCTCARRRSTSTRRSSWRRRTTKFTRRYRP